MGDKEEQGRLGNCRMRATKTVETVTDSSPHFLASFIEILSGFEKIECCVYLVRRHLGSTKGPENHCSGTYSISSFPPPPSTRTTITMSSNGAADNIGDLLDKSTNLRALAPAAVGSQVALMSVISVSPPLL